MWSENELNEIISVLDECGRTVAEKDCRKCKAEKLCDCHITNGTITKILKVVLGKVEKDGEGL